MLFDVTSPKLAPDQPVNEQLRVLYERRVAISKLINAFEDYAKTYPQPVEAKFRGKRARLSPVEAKLA